MLFGVGQPVDAITPNIISVTKTIQTEIVASAELDFIYIEYDLPDGNYNSSFKAYMDYRKITDKTSKQWELQQQAYTDDQGFRRIGDDFVIAAATYYSSECGGRFRVTLDSGYTFTAIVGEIKKDKETDELNMFHPMIDKKTNLPITDSDGREMINILEFVIDEEVMDEQVLYVHGDVSHLGLKGEVVKIEKIERIE